MKSFIKVLFASLLVFAGAANAQFVVGVVGWSQGGGASSSSGVNGGGGSGAALAGISGTQTTATASNISAAQVKQVPGSTVVITESLSNGGMQSTSGALGLAAAGSTSNFASGGAANGGAFQGAVVGGFLALP